MFPSSMLMSCATLLCVALCPKGEDVTDLVPNVFCTHAQVKTVELKKLVYTYLVHYADANPACRELALLAISSYQRDLVDSNQLIRSLALRVLCSIRVREIVQIQVLSVKKASSDR
jgi:AP-3 complex subunit beta